MFHILLFLQDFETSNIYQGVLDQPSIDRWASPTFSEGSPSPPNPHCFSDQMKEGNCTLQSGVLDGAMWRLRGPGPFPAILFLGSTFSY